MYFASTGKQEFNMSHCTCAKTAANYFTNKLLLISILCSGSKFKSQHINTPWVTYAVNTLAAILWFQQNHFQMAKANKKFKNI